MAKCIEHVHDGVIARLSDEAAANAMEREPGKWRYISKQKWRRARDNAPETHKRTGHTRRP